MKVLLTQTRFIECGSLALLVSLKAKSPRLVMRARKSFRRLFWRLYRVGPGCGHKVFAEAVDAAIKNSTRKP